MSIEELEIVDVLSINPKSYRGVLTVSDHLDWSMMDEHLRLLQAKLNRYVAFIQSGEAQSSLPDQQPREFEIEVVFQFEPPADAIRFLDLAREFLSAEQISFSHRVLWEH